jgi:nicotinate-nucleotide pyrophosphorylase
MNEPLSLKTIEHRLYSLKDSALLNDNHQAAITSVCEILSMLRLNLGYDAKNTSIYTLKNLIEKTGN